MPAHTITPVTPTHRRSTSLETIELMRDLLTRRPPCPESRGAPSTQKRAEADRRFAGSRNAGRRCVPILPGPLREDLTKRIESRSSGFGLGRDRPSHPLQDSDPHRTKVRRDGCTRIRGPRRCPLRRRVRGGFSPHFPRGPNKRAPSMDTEYYIRCQCQRACGKINAGESG